MATPGWLDAMARAAERADIVGGLLDWETLNDPVIRAWRPQGPMTDLLVDHGFMRYAPGGNLGVWTRIAREIGWDERFRFGSSDHGFAWQAQLAGYTASFAPDAVMQQRYRRTLPAMARQQFRYGSSGPQLQRAYRALGLPIPTTARRCRSGAICSSQCRICGTPELAAATGSAIASFRLGRLVGSARARVLCL